MRQNEAAQYGVRELAPAFAARTISEEESGGKPCSLHAFRRTLAQDAFFQRRRRGIYVELPSNKIQSPIGAAYAICVNLLVCKAGKMPLLDGA
jgi:hypothetical protein